jgi:hypothetical protein
MSEVLPTSALLGINGQSLYKTADATAPNQEATLPQNWDSLTAFGEPMFETGVFTVGPKGEVGVDFLLDGGKYQGELAIFSLKGIDQFEFSRQVGSTIGVNLRNSRQLSDRSSYNEPYQKWLDFEAWAYGERVNDLWIGKPDALWYKIKTGAITLQNSIIDTQGGVESQDLRKYAIYSGRAAEAP